MDPVNRLAGIGSSELARIAGDDPWGGPASVWLEKVGLAGGREPTPAMTAGLDLEGTVVRMSAAQLDTRFIRNHVTFRHPDWPDVPLYATPDGFGPGRRSGVEAKVVGHRLDDWKRGPPAYVRAQVQGQMACLPRLERVWVGALIGGQVHTYQIDRDPDAITAIEHGVVAWWRTYVIPEVAPEALTKGEAWDLLRARVRVEARPSRIAGDEEELLGRQLVSLMEQQDDIANLMDGLRRDLATHAAGEDIAGKGWRARWGERRSTDWAILAREEGLPRRLVESYTHATKTFTFRRAKGEEPDDD